MLCLLTTSFNIARFERGNEVRRKALKAEKKWNTTLFGNWNPLCWNPESNTRNPESTARNPESKTVLDSLTWSDAYDWESNENQELAIEMLRSVSLSGESVSTVDTRHFATKNVFKTLPIERRNCYVTLPW